MNKYELEKKINELEKLTVEVSTRAIVSDDVEASSHIIIEGNNHEAFPVLGYTHSGKH